MSEKNENEENDGNQKYERSIQPPDRNSQLNGRDGEKQTKQSTLPNTPAPSMRDNKRNEENEFFKRETFLRQSESRWELVSIG